MDGRKLTNDLYDEPFGDVLWKECHNHIASLFSSKQQGRWKDQKSWKNLVWYQILKDIMTAAVCMEKAKVIHHGVNGFQRATEANRLD